MAILALSGLLFSGQGARAEETAPDENATPEVGVLTFGPGTGAFTAFGHNAFRIRDPRNQTDLVYNFGTFRFDSPLLIVDFLKSRFKYWLGVKPFYRMASEYRLKNRFIIEQVLDLKPEDAIELTDALVENAKPENRVYLYNYYRDNCSTRVRDAIDRIVGGQLKKQFDVPGKMTLREHSLRATADILPAYLGIDTVLGDYIDQPETVWQEMFLPEILEEGLDKAVVEGPEGKRPLVKKTKVLYPGEGGPRMRPKPPERTFECFLVGFFVGLLFAVLAFEAFRKDKTWARALFSLLSGLFGLFAGLMGFIIIGLWTLTDHDPAYGNENLFQFAPWAVLLAGCVFGIFRKKPRAGRLAFWIAASGLGAALLGLALKVLPIMDQDNQRIIAVMLPLWSGLFAGVVLLRYRGKTSEASEAPAVKPTPKKARRATKRRR
jgi:hypothetical protein